MVQAPAAGATGATAAATAFTAAAAMLLLVLLERAGRRMWAYQRQRAGVAVRPGSCCAL
jgi:hypothetical protein